MTTVPARGLRSSASDNALELRGVARLFGALAALSDVTLSVRPGERRAVALEQVPADDVAGREVDEVPLVDAVVPAQVEVVQLGPPLG